MTEHLSGEQISRWMMGDREPATERHVSECEACRAELANFHLALAEFRGAVHTWSASPAPPAWRPETRTAWFSWPRLALAAAMLLLLIALPAYWSARQHERAAEAARADAELLEQVDSEISRAVPEPMEPLVNLVTWSSNTGDETKKVTKQ